MAGAPAAYRPGNPRKLETPAAANPRPARDCQPLANYLKASCRVCRLCLVGAYLPQRTGPMPYPVGTFPMRATIRPTCAGDHLSEPPGVKIPRRCIYGHLCQSISPRGRRLIDYYELETGGVLPHTSPSTQLYHY